MKSHKDINVEIIKLWKKHKQLFSRTPLQYPKFKQNSILFIGINPSSSKNAFNNEEIYQHIEQGKSSKKILEQLIQHEIVVKENYTYFKKFKEISVYTSTIWEHIDILPYRETSQATIKSIIKQNENIVQEHMELVSQLIEIINPKIIIVANAYASKLINEYLSISKKSFEQKGFDTYKNTPILFTSMLTGQRALDNESFRQLKWKIKKII